MNALCPSSSAYSYSQHRLWASAGPRECQASARKGQLLFERHRVSRLSPALFAAPTFALFHGNPLPFWIRVCLILREPNNASHLLSVQSLQNQASSIPKGVKRKNTYQSTSPSILDGVSKATRKPINPLGYSQALIGSYPRYRLNILKACNHQVPFRSALAVWMKGECAFPAKKPHPRHPTQPPPPVALVWLDQGSAALIGVAAPRLGRGWKKNKKKRKGTANCVCVCLCVCAFF